MASLETTASVLALVSLTVRFLRETADGIRKAHFFRGARFQRKIGNYDADLSTQRTRLLNSLLNVVRAADALHTGDCSIDESLNKGEIPALFQGPGLNARFHTILGQSSRRFLTHVARIESVLTEIKQGLGIRKLTEATGTISDVNDYNNRAGRIKAAYDDSKHQSLLTDLKQLNNDLDSIQQPILDFKAPKSTRKEQRAPLQRLRQLRNNARELFSNLACTSLWKCHCVKEHALLLKVTDAHEQDDEDLETFDVAFMRQQKEWGYQKCRKGGIATFQLRRATEPVISVASEARQIVRTESEKGCRSFQSGCLGPSRTTKVRFVEEAFEELSLKSMAGPTSPAANDIYLTDLCNFFSQPPTLDTTHPWFIRAVTMSSVCHEVQSMTLIHHYEDVLELSTIRDLGCHCTECCTHESTQLDLSTSDRLSLAAMLVVSAFQLQGNWLTSNWSTHDILLRISSDRSSVNTNELHVITTIKQHVAKDSTMKGRLPSESLLEPLGIALAEVLLSRHITHTTESTTTQCPRTPALTMHEAVKKLYKMYGRQQNSIGKAVSQCLSWSGPVSSRGFDDSGFSSAAFDRVIWPIIENHLIFEGKVGASMNGGSHGYSNINIDGNARVVIGNNYGNVPYNYAI